MQVVNIGRNLLSANYQLGFRFFKAILFVAVLALIISLSIICQLSVSDLFVCCLAFMPTAWGLIQVIIFSNSRFTFFGNRFPTVEIAQSHRSLSIRTIGWGSHDSFLVSFNIRFTEFKIQIIWISWKYSDLLIAVNMWYLRSQYHILTAVSLLIKLFHEDQTIHISSCFKYSIDYV
jgi:hypothetical protein